MHKPEMWQSAFSSFHVYLIPYCFHGDFCFCHLSRSKTGRNCRSMILWRSKFMMAAMHRYQREDQVRENGACKDPDPSIYQEFQQWQIILRHSKLRFPYQASGCWCKLHNSNVPVL